MEKLIQVNRMKLNRTQSFLSSLLLMCDYYFYYYFSHYYCHAHSSFVPYPQLFYTHNHFTFTHSYFLLHPPTIYSHIFRDEIFPRLMTFQPDMIFISAGFDAHKKDTINAGYIALVEEDFEWITANLVSVCEWEWVWERRRVCVCVFVYFFWRECMRICVRDRLSVRAWIHLSVKERDRACMFVTICIFCAIC